MKEITAQELRAKMNSNGSSILLDCRIEDDFNWEHIPGAMNIYWRSLSINVNTHIPNKNTEIITYCEGITCNASTHCSEELERLGYTNVIEYPGGLADWKAHEYTTQGNPDYKIAENIYRFPQQSFYGESVGSYLVEVDDFILLVDGPHNLTQEHEDFIVDCGKPIKVFMTHASTAGQAKKLQEKYGAQIYLHEADKDGYWLTVKPDVLIQDGFKFANHLTVIHTPGHSKGSCALYDSHNKILFSGDHISGTKTGYINNFLHDSHSDDVQESMRSAQKLLNYDFDTVLPFHYSMIRNNAKQLLVDFIKKHS